VKVRILWRVLLVLALLDGVVVSGLVPILSAELGERASLAFGLYFAGLIVGQLVVYRFPVFTARPRVAVAYQLAMAGVMAYMAFAPFQTGLLVGRAIEGVVAGFILPMLFDVGARAGPPEDKERRVAWFNSVFGLGFVAGPLIIEAALRAGDARPVLATFAGLMTLGALAVWVTLRPGVGLSELPPGSDPPEGFDAVYPLLYAKVIYGFSLAFAASHAADRFPEFGIAGLMLAMSVVFVAGQGLGSVVARRAPRPWLIVALPTLAAAVVATYAATSSWFVFLTLALVHSVLILVAYAGITGTPNGPRAFALFNCLSDPGMLVGSALAGLGLQGGWGVAALGLVPLGVALARPTRLTRAEALFPFIGPITALKMWRKQHHPAREPVDRDTSHLSTVALTPWRHPEPAPPEAEVVRLLFAGDLATSLTPYRWHDDLRAHIAAHDLAVLNLEGATGPDAPPRAGLLFEVPVAQLDALVGPPGAPLFAAASVANNHALDRGARRVTRTLSELTGRGVTPVCATPRVLEVGGVRVGLLAATFGTNVFWRAHDEVAVVPPASLLDDPMGAPARALLERIAALRERVDVVVLSYHWGFESEHHPSTLQHDAWQVLRAAGVDVLHGHHSHVVQPFAVGEGGADLCLYSCGNLRMQMDFDPAYTRGALFTVELRVGEGGCEVGAVTPTWFTCREDDGVLAPVDA
jgi:MFS family permease